MILPDEILFSDNRMFIYLNEKIIFSIRFNSSEFIISFSY